MDRSPCQVWTVIRVLAHILYRMYKNVEIQPN